MKTFFTYYVVDTLTESIVTSFEAISDDMARFIYNKLLSENEKVKSVGEFLKVYRGSDRFVAETYDEVTSDYIDLFVKPVEVTNG